MVSVSGEPGPRGGDKVLAAPIFLQELVLGVWLLVKGFATLGTRGRSREPR